LLVALSVILVLASLAMAAKAYLKLRERNGVAAEVVPWSG
jgi:hypothetical protein